MGFGGISVPRHVGYEVNSKSMNVPASDLQRHLKSLRIPNIDLRLDRFNGANIP